MAEKAARVCFPHPAGLHSYEALMALALSTDNSSSAAAAAAAAAITVPMPVAAAVAAVRKRNLARHFILKNAILPRQARDKHKESTQKKGEMGLLAGLNRCERAAVPAGAKNAPFVRPFLSGHFDALTTVLPRQARDKQTR
eukprot:COSAG06_NODE_4224_length_4453_cov_275.939136_4_plen_141_part_00